jgi:hypothetical protein
MDAVAINYKFILEDGEEIDFDVSFDPQSLELLGPLPVVRPDWTKLDFHQCPNCPYTPDAYSHCPVAVNLIPLMQSFNRFSSHDIVYIEVATVQRRISTTTSLQRGISSLLGLVMALSPCPHTAFFRPMVRFHLPFATDQETTFRAVSSYLLAQYFLHREGKAADIELDNLRKIYREIQLINSSIAGRLRGADTKDAAVNAVILLDLFAKSIPNSIDDSLEEIHHLFEKFISGSTAS